MIKIENHSPFPHFLFEKTGLRGEQFDVLVVGGTFDIVHAIPLAPSTEQLPLAYSDDYYGDPMTSSLRTEGNLVIAKKASDIHVVGNARSPQGTPTAEWEAAISIGKLKKSIRVMGPRWWEYSRADGWRLTFPDPCTEVPLRYELAYGGTITSSGREGQKDSVYASNPVGVGYFARQTPDTARRYPVPQFESFDSPIREIAEEHSPEGFGPICRWWQPRIDKAGTYDDAWRQNRFPNFPDDFDFDFYNAAHPNLVYEGFLNGNEAISLIGFFFEGRVDTCLPGFSIVAVMADQAGHVQPEELRLDTVRFDTDSRKATLVWRISVRRSWALASVVIGAIPPISASGANMPQPALLHR
jgi:hypothetical protein